MSDIKPGFYFIEMSGGDWTVAELIGEEWFVPGTECAVDIDDSYVGPRIPTPDEMEGWQVVPKEPTGPMYAAIKRQDHACGIDFDALLKWSAALRAAPKPGDV